MLELVLALALQQETLESSLTDLFKSLSVAHREACLKAYDDADRDAENFTPGKRPGVLIGDLSDEQYRLLDRGIKLFLSDLGYTQAKKVAEQSHKDGLKSYYLNFYGDPTKEKSWAFRVSEHHLTLVHVNSDPARFGPILLGANPPDIWGEQEDAAIECFKTLTTDDKKKALLPGRAASGRKLGDQGIPLDELSKEAKDAAWAMIEARLKLFAEPQQKKLRSILEAQGKLRLAFFGEMTRRSADGGKGDWKIEGPNFLCDYESSRGHIHMTLRGRAEKEPSRPCQILAGYGKSNRSGPSCSLTGRFPYISNTRVDP
jgi:hypothetical protein